MHLDQFDKLKEVIKVLEDKTRQLKQENYRLYKENLELKNNTTENNKTDENYLIEINKLKHENNQLKIKNNEARARLDELIVLVKRNSAQEHGVE